MSSRPPKALTHAIDILSAFTFENYKLRVVDVASMLGITQSSASRYMSYLFDAGFLTRDENGFYSLGLKVVTLSGIALSSYSIYIHGISEIADLAERTKLPCYIGVYDQQYSYISLASAGNFVSLASFNRLGMPRPLHATAIGKVILAYMKPSERASALAHIEMTQYTEFTPSSPGELEQTCNRIKERGYAAVYNETGPGRASIAAPVFDYSKQLVGAICIADSDQSQRIRTEEKELAVVLEKTARIISGKLGYIG